MLEHIQFCAVDFWFEFDCIKNSLEKKALENKIEKEKKKKELTYLCELWPSPARQQQLSPVPLSAETGPAGQPGCALSLPPSFLSLAS